MDTRAAAQIARRTVATIRKWAATGVVTATKTGCRWDISEPSLRRRLRLDRPRPARRPSLYSITGACGHNSFTRWNLIPNHVHLCGKCQAQASCRTEREATQRVADTYGTGPRATQAQLRYLRNLADRAHHLPAECPPRADWPHIPRATASQLIDTLKNFASTGRHARCECPSGRYGGACTC